MRYALLIVCLMAPFVLADAPAAIDPPKSLQAVDAETKHDAAVKKAKQAFHDAEVAADTQLITDLDSAMNAALTNKNVEEVKRIDAAKERAKAAIQSSGQTSNDASIAWLADTKWLHQDGYGRIIYSDDGTVTCSTWGKPGKWEAIDANSIRQNEPAATVIIYFTADHRHALWLYQGTRRNDVAFATRQ